MKHYTNRTAIKKPPEVALRILRLTQKKPASYGYRARAFDLSYAAAHTARSVAKV